MIVHVKEFEAVDVPEITLRCAVFDERLQRLVHSIEFFEVNDKMLGVIDSETHILETKSIYYFESVDNKLFIYTKDEVYQSDLKLYEVEAMLQMQSFIRISKSMIVNLRKIRRIIPGFHRRFIAELLNGENVIISRQYAPILKEKLGM
ncbi:LytTR family DNA-binding domain-containing protein [Culicoidibacter larvae]|uniref:LytTR family transcriptional regulator n=1 Tax=Culicoidibacter larvae TaxID=2579976 RepID=A0A5R8QGS6_9FIRM|nr:LytTR family DNA-binding domain-containing protein [Culicoidibacter larvae]TLG77215.1 LytTR family transcriptional regulator [Culicoidibacter larvae]